MGTFLENKVISKDQRFQKISFIKVGLLIKCFSKNQPILDTEKDFENQNFEIFDNVVHNFGKSDDINI